MYCMITVVTGAVAADDAFVRVQELVEECHRSNSARNGLGLNSSYIASCKYNYTITVTNGFINPFQTKIIIICRYLARL